MGRKAKFNVEMLEIGQKMPFPKSKKKYVYQYLNNFRERVKGTDYRHVEENGSIFIERIS